MRTFLSSDTTLVVHSHPPTSSHVVFARRTPGETHNRNTVKRSRIALARRQSNEMINHHIAKSHHIGFARRPSSESRNRCSPNRKTSQFQRRNSHQMRFAKHYKNRSSKRPRHYPNAKRSTKTSGSSQTLQKPRWQATSVLPQRKT